MLLGGKTGLVIGVANKHSIAWAIAQSAAGQGARLFFNYQNDRLKENVEGTCGPGDYGSSADRAGAMARTSRGGDVRRSG